MRMCTIQSLIMSTYISKILYSPVYLVKLYRSNLFPMTVRILIDNARILAHFRIPALT